MSNAAEVKMVKILHVLTSLDAAAGGTVECVRQISDGLSKLGFSVEILSSDDSPNVRHDFSVKTNDCGSRYFKYGLSFGMLFWLYRNISKYDYIIVNGVWQFHSFAVFLVSSMRQVPYFLYPHGMLTRYCSKVKFLKKIVYWTLVERWVARSASKILFTSKSEMQSTIGVLPGSSDLQWCVVGNGIEVPSFVALDNKFDFAQHEIYRQGHDYLLFLGRIDPIKGIELLINAYADSDQLRRRYKLIIGGDTDNAYARRLISLTASLGLVSTILWVGPVSGAKKWALLSSASALVLPSHHENFSIVCAESLAVGVPVLTTNKVGISLLIEQYRAGFVSDDTEDAFRGLLHHWISMPVSQMQEIRFNAKACYQNELRIDMPARKIASLMNKVNA